MAASDRGIPRGRRAVDHLRARRRAARARPRGRERRRRDRRRRRAARGLRGAVARVDPSASRRARSRRPSPSPPRRAGARADAAPRRGRAAAADVRRWLIAAALLARARDRRSTGAWARISERRARERAAADSAARALAERVRITDSIARVRRDSIVRDSLARSRQAGAASRLLPRATHRRTPATPPAPPATPCCSPSTTPSRALSWICNGRFARLPAATYGMESPSRFYQNRRRCVSRRAPAPTRCSRNCARGARSRRDSAASITFRSPSSWIPPFLPREVTPRLARFAARGLPVYGLRQPNGAVRLYFGAYANARAGGARRAGGA